MSYKKAIHILPPDLLMKIQEYIDGECIYIPRVAGSKKEWGATTAICEELETRNKQIYEDYLAGYRSVYLSQKYFLSQKSIQRIVRLYKKNKTN